MASFFEKLTGSITVKKTEDHSDAEELTVASTPNYEAETVFSKGAVAARGKEKK